MKQQPLVPEGRAEQASVAPNGEKTAVRAAESGKTASSSPLLGTLPAMAPLANPYVPFQQNTPQTYPAKEGVVRGTLFPGLDLPFMGKVNEGTLSDTRLHELQALGFALVELGEFLDTHPDDEEAFSLFQSYAALYRQGVDAYEREFGSLTQRAAADGKHYGWIQSPWPWEFAANREE